MKESFVSWLLIAEFVMPFLTINLILIAIIMKERKKGKESIRMLISKIKQNETNERNALNDFLKKKLLFDNDLADNTTKKIINERKFLFRNLISGVLDKNVEAIANLENDLTRITDHYHALDTSKLIEVQQDDKVEENLAEVEKIIQLKKDIKSLKHEVHVTLTTLNNIFSEFSSMFGEQVPDREMSVDQIITAMESFAGKGSDDNQSASEHISATEKQDMEVLDDLSEDIENAVNSIESFTNTAENKTKNSADDDSLDSELDDIESALDGLELGQLNTNDDEEEPNWDDAFEESGDAKPDKN